MNVPIEELILKANLEKQQKDSRRMNQQMVLGKLKTNQTLTNEQKHVTEAILNC